jgi:hypothetical protein
MKNNAIVPFDFEGNNVRIVTRDGEAWFVLADVCRVLEIANPRDAATRLKEHEKGSVALTDGTSNGGNPNVTIINEPGFYRLVLRSDKPAAERFQDWVVTEVLPSIRKGGSYSLTAKAAGRLDRTLIALAGEDADAPYEAFVAYFRDCGAPRLREFVANFVTAANLHYGEGNLGRRYAPILAANYIAHRLQKTTIGDAMRWIKGNTKYLGEEVRNVRLPADLAERVDESGVDLRKLIERGLAVESPKSIR